MKMISLVLIPLLLLISGCITDEYYINNVSPINRQEIEEDLRFPVSAIKIKGTIKDAEIKEYNTDFIAFGFKNGEEREAYVSMQLPHQRIENSTLRPHFHWSGEDNTSGYVTWCIDLSCANIGDEFDSTQTLCVNDTYSQNPLIHQMSEMIEYNNTLNESAICTIRIWRDGADDTLNTYAYLHEFDIHYSNII